MAYNSSKTALNENVGRLALARLQDRQVALEEHGVKDVKLCFGNTSKPISEMASEVADALETVTDGSAKEAQPLDDSMQK